ncbi:MAG: nucleotidyltransferase family protein [Ornithinimicrobium sp.]
MDTSSTLPITGLLLAAGQGSRMGQPKAIVEIEGRTLTEIAVETLLAGGCRDVLVVLGADAQRVRTRLEISQAAWTQRVVTAECPNWSNGISASLRTGLASLAARGKTCPAATLVHLVDLPDIGAHVVGRVLDQGRRKAGLPLVLARAAYAGVAGHPALIGQAHWQGVMDSARGDRGAGSFLRRHDAALVECGDLAAGRDLDTPAELQAYREERGRPRADGDKRSP